MFDIVSLIKATGYLGIGGIVFAESGLFIGFFLPGDSLLFTAGLLASDHRLNIFLVIIISFACAVLGDNTGYAFGKKVGPALFKKEKSLVFNPDNLARAKAFFDIHGHKALIFARFIPVVRTFVPILAGAGHMQYSKFLTYNIAGGALWTVGVTMLGYWLGRMIPDIDRYLLPIIAFIILLSILPGIIHVLRDPESRARLAGAIRGIFQRKDRL